MTQYQRLGELSPEVFKAVSDDLNTPKAIKELNSLASRGDWSGLKRSARLLGLLTPQTGGWDWKDRSIGKAKQNWQRRVRQAERLQIPAHSTSNLEKLSDAAQKVSEAAAKISAFTQTKEFQETISKLQQVQKTLEELDISTVTRAIEQAERWQNLVQKNPEVLETVADDVQVSYKTFEKAVDADIVGLVEAREAARAEQNYYKADQLRSMARELGFEIVNSRDGVKWRPIE